VQQDQKEVPQATLSTRLPVVILNNTFDMATDLRSRSSKACVLGIPAF